MAIQKHLNLNERLTIEQSLNDCLSFKAIGRELNRNCTTRLYIELGPDVFTKLFPVILCDNVSEFICYASHAIHNIVISPNPSPIDYCLDNRP